MIITTAGALSTLVGTVTGLITACIGLINALRKLRTRKRYYEKTLTRKQKVKASRMVLRQLDLGEAKQLATPPIAGRIVDL